MSTTEIVAVEPEPLLPVTPDQARDAMAKFQALTAAMLTGDDWQVIPSGRFVKRSGWSKISTGYNVSCEILVEEVVERDQETGEPRRARAVVRAIDRHGRHQDGSGRCAITEERFKKVSGRQKIEHDITATAVTRATNRAISNLVGFGQVSAEEVDGTPVEPPHFGVEVDAEGERKAAALIQQLHPSIDGYYLVRLFKTTLGADRLPEAAARMLGALQWALAHPADSSGNVRQEAAGEPSGGDPDPYDPQEGTT